MKTFTKKLIKAFWSLILIFSVHFSNGQAAGALNFAGGDDVVFFPYNSTSWALGTGFSIEMWLNPNSSAYQLLMYPGYGCSYCPGYVLSIGDDLTCYSPGGNNGKLVFQGSVGKVVSNSTLPIGVWTHAAITYDGQVLKMYINGVLQQSLPMVVATVSTGADRQLGCDNAGCGPRFGYNGSIDEFRIWSGPRSQYEIQTYMNCEFTTTPASLTANYHFNHGIAGGNNSTVNTLIDASLSGSNGNVYLGVFALTGATSNWVAGAIANGYTTTAPPTVAINVQGNGTNIVDGDNTPSSSDHTDFNGALTRTFVIQNTVAGGTLNVAPYLTGPDAACFSITTIPASTIGGVGSTSLVITMVTGGTKSATVNINCNDGTIPVYDFVITATSIKYEAINFDGVNDYITIPRIIDWDFTIEFWMRSTQSPTFNTNTQWYEGAGLVDGDVGGFNEDFGVSLLGSKIAFGVGSSGGDNTIFSQTNVNTGQWVHVAATRNGSSGNMSLYINGVLEATYSGPCCTKNASANLTLGAGNTLLSHAWYNGDLDEVRIWNVVRTQTEILNNMNVEIPNFHTGLYGNYHFNQGTASGNASVTTLVDNCAQGYLGYVYNGTLNNFALTGTTSNWISPGKVPTGYTTQASSLAVMGVTGNGNAILNNAGTSSTLNLTNFQSNTTRTFVITNTGTGQLNINAIQLAGTNPAEFSITVMPSASLTTSGTTSFVVAFTPTAGGVRSASVQIVSTDNATPLFSFLIEGQAPLAEALGIDGSNDYAYRTILTTNTSSITMEAKVYWYGPNTFDQMLMYNGNSSIRGYGIYFNSVGRLFVLFGGGSFPGFNYTLTPNVWTSLSVVLKPGTVELYVNGIFMEAASVGVPGTPSAGLGDKFALGSNDGGVQNFSGRLDEVRFWDKSLTQCEIQTYLNCEIPGAMPDLLANYHFNQGAAGLNNAGITNIVDASGNGNDLTLLFCSLTGTFENWVSPGAVVSGYTVTSPPSASISLTGNGNPISNNSTTVSTANATDFGTGATSATFVINNTSGTLNIGSIVITGANASQYAVATAPASSILVGASSTSFVISFTAAYGGPQNATVNIYSNDCSDPIYNFAISASAPLASALDFDGAGDYISIPANANVPTGNSPYTLEAKIKPDVHSTNGVIGWGDYFTTDGTNAIRLGLGGSTGYVVYNYWYNHDLHIEVPNLADGNWHHVAATYDGTTRKLYLDGILYGADVPGPLSVTNNANMRIGSTCPVPCGGEFFDGKIDEVRVWNYARTQCELRTFKDCEIPGAAPGLVLNYHLNQGGANMANPSVTTAIDASSNGLNGTLVGFALTSTVSNWVSPGSVVNDYTITSSPTESIVVTGSAIVIANNTSTVSTSDGTDFGSASSRTFVIQNNNTGTLTINSVSLTGANASEFSVTTLPSSTLAALATTTFVVAFTPTAGGIRTASVVINNSDCNQGTFRYAIEGAAPLASALDFDGLNDVIIIPPSTGINSQFGSSRITLEGWFYPTSANNTIFPMLIGEAYAGDGNVLFQMSLSGNILRAGFFDGNWNDTIATVALNAWQHFAATYDQQRLNIYVNGILAASKSFTNPLPVGTEQWYIGRRWDQPEFYEGKMDELRVWNVARSQCEIQTYMNCEIPSTASSLVANYHFNQGSHNLNNTSATTLADAAGTYTGTLNSFALTNTSSNWFAPGAIANGFTTFVAPTASISVSGNSNPVTSNSSTVSTANHTDFGAIATRTFVVTNSSGTGALNIGLPFLTGANASEFSITVLPSSTSLISLASTSFVVAFTPTAGGPRSASVNIPNNDCSKPVFSFAVQGAAPTASALTLDGIDDYIEAPAINIPTGNSDFTYEFWVKVKSAQSGHRWITSIGSATSGSLVTIGYDGSNNNRIRVHHFGPDLIANTASITPNVWTHVAVNYRGATYSSEIFINGVYVESLNFGAPLTIPANTTLQIGTFGSNTFYSPNIDLDELRIWNRALCQPEIQNNLNCEIATTAPGLVANYHFNQGSIGVDNSTVTLLTDASGSTNTGTLTSFSLNGTASNWSGPGAVNSGSGCSVFLNPEINIVGNGQNIVDGDIVPSTNDNTDFGAVCANTIVTKTFTIQNTGTGTLSVGSITMSGADAASFSVSAISPASSVSASGTATFAVTFTPVSTGVKNATVNIPSNDCDEAAYDFVITGTCNALPSVSVNTTNSVICNGFTTSVSGSGASTYTWLGGTPTITNGVAFSPTITGTYTLNGTDALTGCTSTNAPVQTITVNPIPTVTANTTSSLICNNGMVTLNGSGADTYTWVGGSPTVTDGVAFNPTVTTSYTLSGTYTLTGCISTNVAVQTISVNPTPTVGIVSNSNVVCFGGAPTLTASGAVTYTWLPGNFTTAILNPTPALTTTYTLTGSSAAGCTNTNLAQQVVTVNPLPVVTATATSYSICLGGTTAVNASGGANYNWTGSLQNNIAFSPNATTSYTVTGTDANGCQNTTSLTITVEALPSVTANITSTAVCAGTSLTLSGSGANTYTWTGGITDNVGFVPPSNNSYTLTGISPAGCTSTNAPVVSVTVNSLPAVVANANSAAICEGQMTTLTGSGAVNYTWSDGVTDNVAFSPTVTATYTVTGTDINTCQNTATVNITVNSLPTLSVVSTNTSSCEAENNTLTVSGAGTYSWSTSETDTAIVVSPTTTTSYTVTGTTFAGCSNTAVYTQSVNPCLGTLTAIPSSTNVSCGNRKDGTIMLSVTNSYSNSEVSYIWNPSSLCPGNDCAQLNDLDAGTYSVTVKVTYTLNGILVKTDSIVMNPIIIDKQIPACDLKVFTGLTPNADGNNDTWQIENIDQFPNNKVMVFNRWGEKVFEINGYNNIDKAWPLNGNASKLPSSTYFYVIDPGDGSKPLKGWVELIKN